MMKKNINTDNNVKITNAAMMKKSINTDNNIKIRNATIEDLESIAGLESICFPEKEAATKEAFKRRLQVFADHFWLLEESNVLVSMINGILTDEVDLSDEMYSNSDMHQKDGKWLMIFGVETRPDYQRKGFAGYLLKHVIDVQKAQGKYGIVLTCKKELLEFYSRFGFQNEGVSKSTHGDVVWYQMRLRNCQ